MSGHSHYKTVKRTKETADAKKSKLFSKLSQEIIVVAKEGGDSDTNVKLRQVLDRARAINMPSGSIERAIKKGTGELKGEQLQEVLYEAYGPGGISLLIEVITDNKNRTLGEIKQVLVKHQGKFAESGSVQWMFERHGVVSISSIKPKEDVELAVIEAGAQDMRWHNGVLDVYTKPEDLESLIQSLKQKGLSIESASLDWVPKEHITIGEKEQEAAEQLFKALDELDAIQDIYSSIL